MHYRVKQKSEIIEWVYYDADSKEHFIELMEDGAIPELLQEIEFNFIKTYWDSFEEVTNEK